MMPIDELRARGVLIRLRAVDVRPIPQVWQALNWYARGYTRLVISYGEFGYVIGFAAVHWPLPRQDVQELRRRAGLSAR